MSKRLPHVNEIISVYAVIVFMVYGWTLAAFSGKFPSWSRFLPLGEILSIYSYSLLTNFIESLFFLAFLLVLSAILPPRFMLDKFVLRGTIVTISLLGALMFNLLFYTNSSADVILGLPAWLFITVCGLLFMAILEFLSQKIPLVKATLVKLPEWLMVFLYTFMSLSLLALVTIVIRSLG